MYDWITCVTGSSLGARWKTWHISFFSHSISAYRTRPLCASIYSHRNKDVLPLDLPLLALFSAANEPVLAAKFICLAATPQIIVGHKTGHWWMGWMGGWRGRVLRGIISFYFSQFHPEKIKCRDRLLKLNVTCECLWYWATSLSHAGCFFTQSTY